jgi:leucyl aminopeptidase
MNFSVSNTDPEKQKTPCVVVGLYESRRLSPQGRQLDRAAKGYLSKILKRGDIDGKAGQALLLHNVPHTRCDRVLLVGCGHEKDFGDARFRLAIAKSVSVLSEASILDAVSYLTALAVNNRDAIWKMRQAVIVSRDVAYRFDQLKSKGKSRSSLKNIALYLYPSEDTAAAERAVHQGSAIANGMDLAKTLGNLPGNLCTPSYLAGEAQALGKRHRSVTVEVLDTKEIEALGMGAFLSVAKGSRQPPKFITLTYRGDKRQSGKPVVLVGKGITFDAGGISIKPAQGMDEMKYDMCGAASVMGTMAAAAQLRLAVNLVGVIPTCENLPDGAANKPGDVVTSLSGQTIEILNTDAEGRLILCDALTYCERYKPEVVIDIATLTGACVVALGKHASGLLSNDHELTQALLASGQTSGDRAWELPLWEEYQDQLKSNFADMANIGGRDAGTITAACFLWRFTKKFRWAHLDIAGTAWTTGDRKGATGRPVPLLVQYLLDRLGDAA